MLITYSALIEPSEPIINRNSFNCLALCNADLTFCRQFSQTTTFTAAAVTKGTQWHPWQGVIGNAFECLCLFRNQQRIFSNTRLFQWRVWGKKFVIKIANINNYTHVSYCSTEAAPLTAHVYLNRRCWFLLLNVRLLPLLFSVTAPVLFFIDIGEIETTGGGWGGEGFRVFLASYWNEHAEVITLWVVWFCGGTYSAIIIPIFFYKWQVSEAHSHFSLTFSIFQQYWWKRIEELSDAKPHYFNFMKNCQVLIIPRGFNHHTIKWHAKGLHSNLKTIMDCQNRNDHNLKTI